MSNAVSAATFFLGLRSPLIFFSGTFLGSISFFLAPDGLFDVHDNPSIVEYFDDVATFHLVSFFARSTGAGMKYK